MGCSGSVGLDPALLPYCWKDDPTHWIKRLVCEISDEAAVASGLEITTLLVTEGWKDGATAASRMKITKRLVVDR